MSTRNGAPLYIAPRAVLPHFPAVVAANGELERIRHGNAVNLPEFSGAPLVRVFDSHRGDSELVAIARRIAGSLFQPKVVLI